MQDAPAVKSARYLACRAYAWVRAYEPCLGLDIAEWKWPRSVGLAERMAQAVCRIQCADVKVAITINRARDEWRRTDTSVGAYQPCLGLHIAEWKWPCSVGLA